MQILCADEQADLHLCCLHMASFLVTGLMLRRSKTQLKNVEIDYNVVLKFKETYHIKLVHGKVKIIF